MGFVARTNEPKRRRLRRALIRTSGAVKNSHSPAVTKPIRSTPNGSNLERELRGNVLVSRDYATSIGGAPDNCMWVSNTLVAVNNSPAEQ
ncbi:unnamed protein product, partial [Iphiclides podalirius]